MPLENLTDKFTDSFEKMSPKHRLIAKFLLQNPEEVAISSTREIAEKLDINPGTLVRFSQQHGFSGFPELRQLFKEQIRQSNLGFVKQAQQLQSSKRSGIHQQLIETLLSSQLYNISSSYEANAMEQLETVATSLLESSRVFICGHRMCFSPAFTLAYRCRMIRPDIFLSDGLGGTENDELRHFGPGDAVLTIGLEAYSSQTVASAKYARNAGVATSCITDTPLSPLALYSDHVLMFNSEGPGLLGSIVGVAAIIETLFTIMVAKGGRKTLQALKTSESQLKEFSSYATGGSVMPES